MESKLTVQRPPWRVKSIDAQKATPAVVRRYLREISALAREAAESENPAVTKLGLQVLARNAAYFNSLLGMCGESR
jgi:hypothetical protein